MKAIALAVALQIVSRLALAQDAADPVQQIGACSLMEREERLECFDNLSRRVAPARPSQGANNWIISETTSPVDYTPIVTATAFSRDGPIGASMQLVARCRDGRTELIVAAPVFSRGKVDYTVSYRVNNDQPVQSAASSLTGTGVAFAGDVVRLLQSLPEEGELAIRLVNRGGDAQEGHFVLGGLRTVRERLAAVCNWQHAVARPRDR